MTAQEVYNIARDAGFSPVDAREMTALARRESSWNPSAFRYVAAANSVQGPETSYGLWQINMTGSLGPYRRNALGLAADNELFNPTVNARAAKWLFDLHGGHAQDWYTDRYGSQFGYAEKFQRFLAALPSVDEMEAAYTGGGGGVVESGASLVMLAVSAVVVWYLLG